MNVLAVGTASLAVYALVLSWFGYRNNRTRSESELRWLREKSFDGDREHLGAGAAAGVLAIRHPRRFLNAGCILGACSAISWLLYITG